MIESQPARIRAQSVLLTIDFFACREDTRVAWNEPKRGPWPLKPARLRAACCRGRCRYKPEASARVGSVLRVSRIAGWHGEATTQPRQVRTHRQEIVETQGQHMVHVGYSLCFDDSK